MHKEQIGNATLYVSAPPETLSEQPDEDTKQLQEIVSQYEEADYQAQITARKNWTAMYQLAQTRGNVLQWLAFPPHAKVLELGAGCGTLTSVLLKKGAQVTCQEENIHYCRLNAARNGKAENAAGLTIYAKPFDACEPLLDKGYDRIVLCGLPASVPQAEKLLGSLRGQLKKDGELLLAIENKFGLKYWAGNKEPHTRKYFAGLESAGTRQYSRKDLKKLFAAAGFMRQEFYYPYPDYRFALDIYSDAHLPKKGSLTYNIANYEDDRMLLFDEQKVFDNIIEEGQFPFFSNSYLCIAGCGSETAIHQKIIYTRYASDRSRAYAVRTDIVKEADGFVVRKHPIYPQGHAHIAHIAKAYERLSSQYAQTGLRFNRCALLTDDAGNPYAEFEFLNAHTLQEQVEQAVSDGNLKKIFDILGRMVQYIKDGSNCTPFVLTEDFTRVFGEVSTQPLEHAACSEVSDIDFILSNILADADGTWHVIDYEWTFFFPIPQNFMIYRTLFFLSRENPQCGELAMEKLLEATGISHGEAVVYEKMEEGFQRFVTGGQVPYREMVNLLERKFFNVVQLKADYDRIAAQNELLKGRGLWKIAKKLKEKLTGN